MRYHDRCAGVQDPDAVEFLRRISHLSFSVSTNNPRSKGRVLTHPGPVNIMGRQHRYLALPMAMVSHCVLKYRVLIHT